MNMYMYHIRLNNGCPKVLDFEVKSYYDKVANCENDMKYLISEMYKVQDIIESSPYVYGVDLNHTINSWNEYQKAKGNKHLMF